MVRTTKSALPVMSGFEGGHGRFGFPFPPDAGGDANGTPHTPTGNEAVKVPPYRLAWRRNGGQTTVRVGSAVIGGKKLAVIAGPCAIEGREQLLEAARAAAAAGATVLRGGAFKPRTSPYSFQGLELEGLKIMREVSRETGLATVTEVVDERSLELAVEYVDMLQIGARNMQNYHLLRAVAGAHKPVLLKRGLAATVEEWLLAAEYLLASGNGQVVLCERGIRTFEPSTRNTLDLSAVALAKRLTHLPVIVDPSHATGDPDLVVPMSKAAVAAGADGLIIEMHPCPAKALCDGKQSLTPEVFAFLMNELRSLSPIIGRDM
ncbi:MAG: 3-deoxy-7-phosphoheptulonate synthase [Bacillota bacterium]|uniref:3-deoxy-7-phosphoheptulonate synthase n=1 Tax=Desulforudis sp. DRI-14 TaxID=3459793 RepID=UPI00346E6F77